MVLTEHALAPNRNTLQYAIETAEEVNALALAFVADPDRVTSGAQSKPDGTPITELDSLIHALLQRRYPDQDVVLQSEEGEVTDTPAGTPNAHADPQDGTENFRKAYETWVASGKIGPFVCGSMFSLGVIRSLGPHRSEKPEVEHGVLAASFLPGGPRIYAAGKNTNPTWRDSRGTTHMLNPPDMTAEQARAMAQNEPGKMVVVLSANSAKRYGAPLMRAGFGVEEYDAAVTSGLAVFDNTHFETLKPGVLNGRMIVSTIMHGGKNWDLAGLQAMADGLDKVKITNLHGTHRTYRRGEEGSIVALSAAHGLILEAIALQ